MLASRPRVLIAHPSRTVCEEIAFHLRVAGMAPSAAINGREALEALDEGVPAVLVTGLDLDHESTWTAIRRTTSATAAGDVVVVADSPTLDQCLELGAVGVQRVISIRHSLRPLVRHVVAAIPGAATVPVERSDEECCRLALDVARMAVFVEDRPVELTPLEYKLLCVLMEEREAVVRRDEIFRRVWGTELAPGNRSIDVLVKRLRQRLEPEGGCCSFIHTVYGVGYRFSARSRVPA